MAVPEARSAGRARRWLARAPLVAAGAALSALLAASAFFRFNLHGGLRFTPRFPVGHWIDQLPAHARWVGLFIALTACIVPLRALQWRFTLAEPAPRFSSRYHAVALGAFFHNAVPGKMGELFRAFFLARRQNLSFFESLGSVLVCKLLELGVLLAIVAAALAGPGSRFASHLGVAVGLAALLLAALAGIAMAGARWAMPAGVRLAARGRFVRLGRALVHLGRGLAPVQCPARMAMAFAASFGPVLASAIAYGIALRAIGVPRGLFAGGVVLGAVSLGQLMPGLPVGTGMYYLTSSWAARALGAPPAAAATFAALTHLASVAPQLVVGFASLLIHRVRPRDVARAREELARIAEPDPSMPPASDAS